MAVVPHAGFCVPGHGDSAMSRIDVVSEAASVAIGSNGDAEKIGKKLFEEVWASILRRSEWGGEKDKVNFPRNVVFLSGAPGAGKGTNALAIMRIFEIKNRPIEVSSLLRTPECEELKNRGLLVGDGVVVSMVMDAILNLSGENGVIVDGFPRTAVQAYFLKHLVAAVDGQVPHQATKFKVITFSVSRDVSIERQLARGKLAVQQSGFGGEAVRESDLSQETAALRYETYEKSIGQCLDILRGEINLYEIDANGDLDGVRRAICEALDGAFN
jgi:adenylate kinase